MNLEKNLWYVDICQKESIRGSQVIKMLSYIFPFAIGLRELSLSWREIAANSYLLAEKWFLSCVRPKTEPTIY